MEKRVNNKKKPIVYIETTVPSYLTARPSNNLDNYYRQFKTREWWINVLPKVEPVISEYVLRKASKSDPEASQRRLEAIRGFPVLPETDEVVALAKRFEKELSIPIKAQTDALHLSCAVIYQVDYLLSWNFDHIVSAPIKRTFAEIGNDLKITMPTLCTPEELMEI